MAAIEVAAKAECWLRAVADAGYAIPGPPASALGPVFAPSTTLASNSRLRRSPTSMSFNEESTSSSATSSIRDRCCSAEGCGVLAQWVPLHAVSCSNLIETGGCAESREILLFECFPEKPREAFPFPPPFLPYFPFLFTASSSSSSFSSLLSLSSRYNNLDFTRTTTRYTLRGGSNFRRCGCLFPLSFSSSFFLFLFFFFFDARGMFCLFVGFDYRCMISVNADVTSAISSDSTVSAVARISVGHIREFFQRISNVPRSGA